MGQGGGMTQDATQDARVKLEGWRDALRRRLGDASAPGYAQRAADVRALAGVVVQELVDLLGAQSGALERERLPGGRCRDVAALWYPTADAGGPEHVRLPLVEYEGEAWVPPTFRRGALVQTRPESQEVPTGEPIVLRVVRAWPEEDRLEVEVEYGADWSPWGTGERFATRLSTADAVFAEYSGQGGMTFDALQDEETDRRPLSGIQVSIEMDVEAIAVELGRQTRARAPAPGEYEAAVAELAPELTISGKQD